MNFKDICEQRFSVRSYSSKHVEDEKIAQILDMVKSNLKHKKSTYQGAFCFLLTFVVVD